MIYFFDNELNMVKVATSKNVISAVHEHELNGLILGTVETDLRYTEAFINDVDYFGYYYKDNYYLHKIKRVEHEHENELVRITGRHIFFEDMLYGDYIRDVRPENRDALYILNQTISSNTRWQTVMTDTSKLHSETYYWVPPMEVLNDLTENVGIEYEPRILFDGQKINGFQLHVANRIGEDTPIRVPFGSRVLNLKYEVDYSEIVTALYGHGKGEEVGDGYGRRINFSSVNFSRNGVVSPAGRLYMENPNVTAQYGKDDGSPKFGRIIFEDIESASELADATYEAYLEQSRPKMLFEASVVDLGDVGMGDGVLIIRREYDVYFNARIHKLMVDLLDAENADVELGDYAHFKESKVQRKTRESNNQYRRETSSRIQQLKEQFNDRFDGEVNQMRDDFEQALIDAHAEIQAAEERMTERINSERDALSEKIDADIAQARLDADAEYARIESEVSGAIDSTRSEMETAFESKVADAREYADSQIANKETEYQQDWDARDADIQQTIETVVGGNVDALDTNLLDVNSRLFQTRNDLIERINNIDTQSFNLIRGSRLDETAQYTAIGGTVIEGDELPYFRYGTESGDMHYIEFADDINFETGKTYTLSLDYLTSNDVDINDIKIMPSDGSAVIDLPDMSDLIADGLHHRTHVEFTVPRDVSGRLRIGNDFNATTKAQIDIRLPYLTTSGNTQWVFHPSDSYESIMTVMSRIDEFEGEMRSRLEDVRGELGAVSDDLETARSGLQAQLDDAKAELANMEVGGRNLRKDPGDASLVSHYHFTADKSVIEDGSLPSGYFVRYDNYVKTGSSNSFYFGSTDSKYTEDIRGKEVVLSFWLKGDVPFLMEVGNSILSVGTEWTRIVHKIVWRSSGNEHYSIRNDEELNTIDISSIKIEYGTVLTDWTPAPEDTEEKITTLNQEIEFIDGQLSAKLEQTDIEPINDKITEYGNTLTANAQSIESLIDKTELHDGDITEWSNQTTANAEELTRTLSRLSDTEIGLESAQHTLSETADGLERTISRVSETESGLEDAQLAIEANADAFKLTVSKDEFEGVTAGLEGRNLFVTSEGVHTHNPYNSLNEVTDSGFTTTANNENGGHNLSARISSFLPSQLSAGEKYTVSGYMYVNGEPIDSEFLNTLHSSSSLSSVGAVINDDGFFYETFEVIRSNQSYLLQAITSAEIGDVIEVRKLMVTRGNAVLDYQPAPEDTQSEINQLNTDITIEAGRINALLTRTSSAEQSIADISFDVDGITADFASYKEDVDGEVGSLSAQVASYEASVDGFRAEVGTLQGDIDGVDSWIADKGSIIDGNADAISARVWKTDIDNLNISGRNLISNSDVVEDFNSWSPFGYSNIVLTDNEYLKEYLWIYRNGVQGTKYVGTETPLLTEEIIEGRSYILRFKATHFRDTDPDMTYMYLMNTDTGVNDRFYTNNLKKRKFATNIYSDEWIYEIPFDASFSGNAGILIGTYSLGNSDQASFYIKEPMVVEGTHIQSDWTPAPEDNIKHTDFILESDGFFLGGKYVGGDHYSTAIVGSKDGIDILANRMRVTGDLIVKGDVEAWSMAAVKAEFGSLWADEFKAITIDVEDISGVTAEFNRLYTLNANIERLVSQIVFTDAVHTKSLDAIEANIGRVNTAILDAITIQGQHIDGNTITGRNLRVDSAMVDKFIANTAFINEMNALSLNAVYADLRKVDSEIMDTNILKADWIQGGNALLDKVFANTAMFERMMAKSGFISTMSAITLDLHELTIWRPDGVAFVMNGMERFGHPVPLTIDIDDSVTYNHKYFETNARGAQQVAVATGDHAGRYYNLVVGVGMRNDAQHASTRMAVIIRPQNVPSGASGWVNYVEEFTVFRDNPMQYHTLNYPMGRPTYGAMSFTIEFWRIGDSGLRNPVQLRTRRSWVSA